MWMTLMGLLVDASRVAADRKGIRYAAENA